MVEFSQILLHSDSGGDRSIPPLQVENDMIQDGLGFNRSGPIALDVSSIFNISSTSFSVTVICSRPWLTIT
jgi:hypothetical protein